MLQIVSKQLQEDWIPKDYQKKGVKFLVERCGAALFFDPGLGKTSITLSAIKILKEAGLIKKVLILAPLRVCYSVWPNEIEKWSNFNHLKCVVLHGPKKEELLKEDADIFIINFEGLQWLTKAQKVVSRSGKVRMEIDTKRWQSLGFDTLVIDELSKFKATNTNRHKTMRAIAPLFTRRWGLTGSPAANSLLDLFGQCLILDDGRTFGKYITRYRKEYFDQGFDGFSWELKEGCEKAIYDRVAPLALRMGEEMIDMPSCVENEIILEMPKKLFSTYKKLKNNLVATLNDDTVSAANKAIAVNKLRQFTSGAIYVDDPVEALIKLPTKNKKWAVVHDLKIDALKSLVEELQGQPLLVAYEFSHDLKRIQEAFGKDVPYIGGGVSARRAQDIERDWNEGKLPLLLGHPASMGHGLNLQKCGMHVCWFSLSWSYELYDQFNRRVRRQGNQSARVFVHHLLVNKTIDMQILDLLRSKQRGQTALFDALKEE